MQSCAGCADGVSLWEVCVYKTCITQKAREWCNVCMGLEVLGEKAREGFGSCCSAGGHPWTNQSLPQIGVPWDEEVLL